MVSIIDINIINYVYLNSFSQSWLLHILSI